MYEVAITALVAVLTSIVAFMGSRRNKQLEGVIEGLQIIIDDQRKEIEQLRRRIRDLEERLNGRYNV